MSERKSSSIPAAAPRKSASEPVKRAQPSSRSELSRVVTAARVPSAEQRAAGKTIVLGDDAATSLEAILTQLPDPSSLPAGTLVVLPAEIAGSRSLARSVLAVFGRTKTIPRVRRCSALLTRGYVDVGAGDDENRADLAWAYVPSSPASEED